MRNGDSVVVGLGLTAILIWATMIIGWIVNIIQLVSIAMNSGALTLLVVLKIVGVFIAPLGSILGIIGMF
jgi:hypothetical protein